MGAEGEAVPPPGSSLDEVQAAIDLARGQGGDSTIIQSEIGRLSDLMNRQTTVTGGDKKTFQVELTLIRAWLLILMQEL